MEERNWLLSVRANKKWSAQELRRLSQICDSYGMKCSNPKRINWDKLLSRVDIMPTHLVLHKQQQNQVGVHHNLHYRTVTYLVCAAEVGVELTKVKLKAIQHTLQLKIP